MTTGSPPRQFQNGGSSAERSTRGEKHWNFGQSQPPGKETGAGDEFNPVANKLFSYACAKKLQ